MRIRRTIAVWAVAAALAGVPAMSATEEKKKEQPAPAPQAGKAKQAEEAKPAQPAQPGDKAAVDDKAAPAEAPKAAVNTIEDLFRAYGMAWQPGTAPEAAPAADAVVWKETAPATPAPKPAPTKQD